MPVISSTPRNHHRSAKEQLVQTRSETTPHSHPSQPNSCHLTFGFEVPVEGAVLCKASPTPVALERFLSSVVADVAHQRALLPEAAAAELAHEGLVLEVRAEMDLLGILYQREEQQKGAKGNCELEQALF